MRLRHGGQNGITSPTVGIPRSLVQDQPQGDEERVTLSRTKGVLALLRRRARCVLRIASDGPLPDALRSRHHGRWQEQALVKGKEGKGKGNIVDGYILYKK